MATPAPEQLTIGRIVLFGLGTDEAMVERPATVVSVSDAGPNLQVLLDGPNDDRYVQEHEARVGLALLWRGSVPAAADASKPEPGHWRWPPRAGTIRPPADLPR